MVTLRRNTQRLAALLALSLAVPALAQGPSGAVCGTPGTPRPGLWTGPAVAATLAGDMRSVLAERRIPGGVLIVVHGGAVIHAEGFGLADAARKRPFIADSTVFPIGSISKTMTALALLDETRRHGITLAAPAGPLAGLPGLRAASGEAVTLAQLLSHTGGFEEAGPAFYHAAPFAAPPSAREHLRRTAPGFLFVPGTRRAYSNYGFAVLAEVAASLGGRPYPALLQQSLFVPLGMRATTAVQPLPAEQRSALAVGYGAGENPSDPLVPMPTEFSRAPGAGEVVSTGADMARYMIALLDAQRHGGGGVRTDIIADAFAPHFAEAPCANAIGRAFWIEHRHGQTLVRHSGETFGLVANMLLFPEHRLGVFYAFNRSDFDALNILEDRIMDRWFAPDRAPTPLPQEAAEAARLAGTYAGSRTSFGNVGALARLLGDGLVELSADPDGGLRYRHERWRLRAPGLWESEHGGRLLAVFGHDGRTAFIQGGAQSFVRANWADLPDFWLASLAAALAVLALCAPALPLLSRGETGAAWRAARWCPAAGLVVLLGGAGLLAAGGLDQPAWAFGPPLLTLIGLGLFTVIPLLAIGGLAATGVLLAQGTTARRRTMATLFAGVGALVILAGWLWVWRLIGWQF